MNKKIALISTFCDIKEKQDILIENIRILKSKGIDVMCLSPNFIKLDDKIIELSDYLFYTKENPLINWPEKSHCYWKTIWADNRETKMDHFLSDYNWAALYQLKKMLEISLTFDYDIFYTMIYDTNIDNELLKEIDNNEVNLYHPRINPNNPDELWEATLHFNIYDREIASKIALEITKEEYLRTNGMAEGEVLKWQKKFNLTYKSHPVKDKIDLYKGKDFFNLSKFINFKFFPSKDNYNLRIVIYDIKNDMQIIIRINENEYKYNLKTDKNILIEMDEKCQDIINFNIIMGEHNHNLTEEYGKLSILKITA